MIDYDQLFADIEAARNHVHPRRAMRVTLECGHLRLMPQINTVMGIGALTACGICADHPTRLVVGIDETGVLFSESMQRSDGA